MSGMIISNLGAIVVVKHRADVVLARDSNGLQLQDDGGNLGIFIEDGGQVGIGQNTPVRALHVSGVSEALIQCTTDDTGHGQTNGCYYGHDGTYCNVWNYYGSCWVGNNGAAALWFDNTTYQIQAGVSAENVNTNMSAGITILQAGYDDEIFALKSTDVDHGVTFWTETDTFYALRKVVATGGVSVYVVGSHLSSYVLHHSIVTQTEYTYGFSEWFVGAFNVDVWTKSGAGGDTPSTNTGIVSLQSGGYTIWGLDAEGDTWQTGALNLGGATQDSWIEKGITIYQDYNFDTALSFKSADMDHGVTGWAETDTYFLLWSEDADGTAGLYGFNQADGPGMTLNALTLTAPSTSLGATAKGILQLNAYQTSGVGVTDPTANAVLLTLRTFKDPGYTTIWGIDEDGDSWQTGGAIMLGDVSVGASAGNTFSINAPDWDNAVLINIESYAHGLTAWQPTNAVFCRQIGDSDGGGLYDWIVLNEDIGDWSPVWQISMAALTAETTKNSSADGMLQFYFTGHNGAGTRVDVNSGGIIIGASVRSTGSVWLLDEGGNSWQSGNVTCTEVYAYGDADTYIDFPGSDVVTVYTGGSLRLTVDASGITLPESHTVHADSVLSADGKYSGITTTKTAGENLAYGDLVYTKSDGKLWLADADAAASVIGLYIALESITADSTGKVLKQGWIREDDWNWTIGSRLYVSATAGDMTHTAPSGSGDAVVCVGWCDESADQIAFFPDCTIVEVA